MCKYFVQKATGCNRMNCRSPHCRGTVNFCYLCSKRLDNNKRIGIYTHFDDPYGKECKTLAGIKDAWEVWRFTFLNYSKFLRFIQWIKQIRWIEAHGFQFEGSQLFAFVHRCRREGTSLGMLMFGFVAPLLPLGLKRETKRNHCKVHQLLSTYHQRGIPEIRCL